MTPQLKSKLQTVSHDQSHDYHMNCSPHIVILDDLDQISGYSTPSVLAELITMLNYRGPLNPTWVEAVHSRDGNMLYPAGLCYLKSSAYFIATRTQARWVWPARD